MEFWGHFEGCFRLEIGIGWGRESSISVGIHGIGRRVRVWDLVEHFEFREISPNGDFYGFGPSLILSKFHSLIYIILKLKPVG